MSNNNKFIKIKEDNRGASLMLVLAVFVIMLTVVMNLLMLVSAGDRTTNQEYETEQTGLYLSSIYDILNSQMVGGTWKDAFVVGETTVIDVEGFEDGKGSTIPVRIEIELERTLATVDYYITYEGREYCISAKYTCRKRDGEVKITLRYCEELT